MSPILRNAAIALVIAATFPCSPASAAQNESRLITPKGWNYEVDSRGNRVAKDKRVTNPDGSWREEIRQGNCITVKERSVTGEYKETRQCNPGKSS